MTRSFWESKSNRATLVFLIVALPFLLWSTLDMAPLPFFVVGDQEQFDGVAELRWQRPLQSGLKVRERGLVRTKTLGATLVHQGTTIELDARSNVEIDRAAPDRIELSATRGHWRIVPDREVHTCTRAVCVTSLFPVEMYYYTPGEVVEILASGTAQVTFGDHDFDLESGDRLIIDELTGAVSGNDQ